MFYYISFLRPPPVQAAPYGTLSIKPQLSNDLRTELFNGTQELFYSWSLEGQRVPTVTKPAKLTTWRLASAYKDIPLPIPPGVREGQQWRLILTGQPQVHGMLNPEYIDLSSSRLGKAALPVMSMPILFQGRGHKGAPKQEMVERSYLVPYTCHTQTADGEGDSLGEKQMATLRIKENTSFDLDKKIWDSGIGLCSWLVDLQENLNLRESDTRLQEIYDALFSENPRTIVELGAGVGMLSSVLSILRSSKTGSGKDRIFGTDVDSAMPLLEENISNNDIYYKSNPPNAMVLDWDDAELPEEIKSLTGLDAIVMADVTYNTASFPSLCRTLSRLARLHAKPPVIILSYKLRDDAEKEFWKMMSEDGIEFVQVGRREGAGGAPIEIWAGQVQKS